MAKTKKEPVLEAKPEVKVEEKVEAVAATPAAETPVATEVATTTTPVAPATQPQTVIVEKKSGSGCWKWLACFIIVLTLCCLCVAGSAYLLITKTGDIIKLLTTSTRNEAMTRVTVEQLQGFDTQSYWELNPPRDLGNNKFEAIIPEDVLLKMIFGSSETAEYAAYFGVDIKEGSMTMQIDIGGLMAASAQNGGSGSVQGVPINVQSLQGVYLNIDITASGAKTISIKSVRIGESALDLANFAGDSLDQWMTDFEASEFYTMCDNIEFKEGYIRLVLNGSFDGNPELPDINVDGM